MRFAGRSALAAAVALSCAATPALAGDRYGSDIKVAESFPAFHGKVSSSNDLCVEHRKVVLYGKVPGPDDRLGKTRSNRRGRWKIEVEPMSGAFYAKARRGGSASLGIVCRKAVSKPVIID